MLNIRIVHKSLIQAKMSEVAQLKNSLYVFQHKPISCFYLLQ